MLAETDTPGTDPRASRHFFLDRPLPESGTVAVGGETRHHLIHVLRMRPGDRVVLRGVNGEARLAEILEVGCGSRNADVLLSILRPVLPPEPPPCHVTIAQAPGKGTRFEEVLQHGVELGASQFVPLMTARSVPDWKGERIEAKLRRWQSIVRAASEQAKRDAVPAVLPPAALVEAARELAPTSRLLLMSQAGVPLLNVVSHPHGRYALFVGPEGGFTDDEEARLIEAGATRVSLGPFVLRTETAALAALGALMAQAAARACQSQGEAPPAL